MIVIPRADRTEWPHLNKVIAEEFESDAGTWLTDPTDEHLYALRSPGWAYIRDREGCIRAFQELEQMCGDKYEHHLTILHQAILGANLKVWLGRAAQITDPKKRKQRIADLELIDDVAFDGRDFDVVEEFVMEMIDNDRVTPEMAARVWQASPLIPRDILLQLASLIETKGLRNWADLVRATVIRDQPRCTCRVVEAQE